MPPSFLADAQRPETYSSGEIIDNGHRFFGSISRGLAEGVESAAKRWGQPNAYVLGQEAGGAFIGGLRYGEGTMYTRNAGQRRVYWQGPSLGLDAGADGDRTMMLVYNLPAVDAIYRRYRRRRRLRLSRRRIRLHRAHRRRRGGRADPLRRRRAARAQSRLSEIHAAIDVEPVLERFPPKRMPVQRRKPIKTNP